LEKIKQKNAKTSGLKHGVYVVLSYTHKKPRITGVFLEACCLKPVAAS
jgi:aromatic ring-opening dioxygenase catalytic subunit (LigB family)